MRKAFGWLLEALVRLLVATVFRSLYLTAEGGDKEALDENSDKHARAILICLPIIPATLLAVFLGGETTAETVFYVSLAAQVAGFAWFVVSFGALPKRHLHAAMITTLAMFCAFLAGVFAMMVVAAIQAPSSLLVIGPIYFGLYIAAALYDSADLLKVGKEEQELLAALAIQRIEKLLEQLLNRLPPTKE